MELTVSDAPQSIVSMSWNHARGHSGEKPWSENLSDSCIARSKRRAKTGYLILFGIDNGAGFLYTGATDGIPPCFFLPQLNCEEERL
jgi:hypothetical protein